MKTLLLFTCAALTTGVIAQKSTSKKVDTRFINVPNYNVGTTDIGSLEASFSVGYTSYGTKRLKDTKSTCLPKGGKLTDAKELTTYYYEHDATRPASYLFLKDGSGSTVFASQISKDLSDKAAYGKDKCEHWMKSTLEKNYDKDKASWEKQDHAEYVKNLKTKAGTELNQNGVISYTLHEIEVYSAKGKGFDYTKMDEAFDLAYDAYEDIDKNGISSDNFDKLGKAIAIWKTEVEQADLDNKDARINKKVAQGLYINLAYAHFTRFEMNDAAVYAQKADQSFGNFTNNTRTEIQAFRKDANRRKAGIEKNAEMVKNPRKMHEQASQSGAIKFTLKDYPGSVSDASSDYIAFAGTESSTIAAASEAANLESGGTSYDKYIVANSMPKTLSIMKFQETLTELPVSITQIEGLGVITISSNDIASIPAEIGNMSSLKKLWLAKNKISELPTEIGNCSELKNLNLSDNPIEKLPESIKNCKNLKSLNLKGTKVSSEHVAELQKWLPKCKIKI